MAAPSGIVWSDVVNGSSSGRKGRLGIYIGKTESNTQVTVNVQVWFWTIYSCTDSGNTFYCDIGTGVTSASTSRGSKTISHTVASGSGWSTSNQTKLYEYSNTYTKGSSAKTYKVYARFSGIDMLSASVYANASFTIPALVKYEITYEPNASGVTKMPSAQTKQHGDTSFKLSSNVPVRTGYTFDGWSTSKSATTGTYKAGATYSANADIQLFAIWKPNTYVISYSGNASDAKDVPPADTKTHGVTLKLSTKIPTRTNYNFLGWATSASATTATYAAGGNYTANTGTPLYAVWELAYTKPRIEDLSISRCDREGVLSDTGTYVTVGFSWKCDRKVTVAKIEFDSDTANIATISEDLSGIVGGTSGTFKTEFPIGEGLLSAESTYTVRLTIRDEVDYTTIISTLSGSKFTIDFKAGGKGAAFGKPAELDDVLDVAFQTRLLGGLLYPVLEPETDLNNERKPGFYTGANVHDYNYVNCPCESGTFTLIVECCGEAGQVRQTYIACSKYKPQRFVRFYYQSTWSLWMSASSEEVVIFEDTEGSAGTINFTHWNGAEWSPINVAHFQYLEIYFTDNVNLASGYAKVWNPNGKTVYLQSQEPGTTIYHRQTAYAISGSSMVPDTAYAGYIRIGSDGTVSRTIGSNYIKITRVVGLA